MKHKLAIVLMAAGAMASAQDLDTLKLQHAVSQVDLQRVNSVLDSMKQEGMEVGRLQLDAMKLDALRAQLAPLATLNLLAQDDVRNFDRAYQNGKRALDHDRFEEAIKSFDASIDSKAAIADGAYYWKAYALNRLHRPEDALGSIAQLRSKFPDSRWLNEAQALEIEIKAKQGRPVDPGAESNEELKLIALQGLMQSDPNRAVPILRKVLTGNQSPAIKDKALFVLSQSGSPEAREILLDLARGKSNPDLQEKAIRYISMMGSSEMRGELGKIYAASNDNNVKREIIRSYLLSGSKNELLQAAKSEKNVDLRREAIRTLAQSGGKEEIWTLYQREQVPDVKNEIIRSMLQDGDSGHLLEIAKTEKESRLRKTAISTLGMMGWGKDTGALVEMYRNEQDESIKHELIKAMFIQQNAKGLIELARAEKNPQLKREIVQQLSLINSKESTDYMMELLNK